MLLPKLFKKSITGAVLTWEIEVQDNKHRTHSGQVGGVITVTEWTECKCKNNGKANATTSNEQAVKDATSKWTKKINREQFVENIECIDTAKFIEPMLAQPYKKHCATLNFNDSVWVQCKLNGARCIATKDGLYSRKGSVWQSVPHISEALANFFTKHPNVVFDGELFNEDLRQDLGSIISLISKKNITDTILEKSKSHIQYYIYDIVDTTTNYQQRLLKLEKYIGEINSTYIKPLSTLKVQNTEDIDKALENWENQGHEGAIIRTNGVYENKRSKHLLKYKTFIDDEFEIVDVLEGEGNLSGKVGKFVLKDERGVTFKSSPIGSHEYWEQMWLDRSNLIGRIATVKFVELTPIKNGIGGVPSFGKVVAIRDYE